MSNNIVKVMCLGLVTMLIIVIFGIFITTNVSADYTSGTRNGMEVALNISFSSQSIIISNAKYNGPVSSMVKANNGDYLAFIREGTSHMGIGDYGVLKLYRSTNNGVTFTYNSTLLSVSNKDVRNPSSGITPTGRIFVFAWVYDCDNPANATSPSSGPLEYLYSDNNGVTWSGVQILTTGIVDGFNGTNISNSYGKLIILGNNRIGMSYFAFNDSSINQYQVRFLYSDNDGLIWSCVNITDVFTYPPRLLSETDIVYIGNNQIVAITRVDTSAYVWMYTSIDNGLTWNDRGQMPPMFSGICRGPSLSIVKDNGGGIWVLALYVYNNYFYDIAYGQDLIDNGIDAWDSPEQYAPGAIVTGYGVAGTCIMNQETGVAKFLTNEYVSGVGTAYVSIQTITVTITLSFDQLHQGTTISLYNSFFIVLLVLGAIVSIGVMIIRYAEVTKGRTLEETIYILVIMIVAIFIVAIFLAGMAGVLRI